MKDESRRFSLNAFKVLGGSYAIGLLYCSGAGAGAGGSDLLSAHLPPCPGSAGPAHLCHRHRREPRSRGGLDRRPAGHRSVVRMPKGSSPERLANIRALGADASVTDLNYDDTVRLVQQQAQEQGWVVIQDTAWEGYWDIPAWIMEGYTTMALEAVRQLEDRPPHPPFPSGWSRRDGREPGRLFR